MEREIERRERWVRRIHEIEEAFGEAGGRVRDELEEEVEREGGTALYEHLLVCGAIPERFGHDSTEEKLYSKYTDCLLAAAFVQMGLEARVLEERADAADVEGAGPAMTFVADAKAFRLSRTAKNQKDFKVESMAKWKGDREFSVLVCPMYQLPTRASQIYEQASRRSVSVLTYTHVRTLIRGVESAGAAAMQAVLKRLLERPGGLPPSKDARGYWTEINGVVRGHSAALGDLWAEEIAKEAAALEAVKAEEVRFLEQEMESIRAMDRDAAVEALIDARKLRQRESRIARVARGEIFDL